MRRVTRTAPLAAAMVLIFTGLSPASLAQTEKTPVIPEAGNSIESFVPEGYRIFNSKQADLNGDGLMDAVVGIQLADDVEAYEHDRPLLILFRRPDGTYRLSARSDHAIDTAPLGSRGDSAIDIHGRTVVLSQGGKGAGQEQYYRFQDAGWYLVGASDFQWNYDNTEGQGVPCPELHLPVTELCVERHHSLNYNTSIEEWRYSIARVAAQPDYDAATRNKVVKRSFPKRPLLPLSEADPAAINADLFRDRTGPPP